MLRVATLEECWRYGGQGVRRGGMLPPIAGGAGYTFIQGNSATGSPSGSATATSTYGSAPAQGDLLVAALFGTNFSIQSSGATMSSTGWTVGPTFLQGGSVGGRISMWWKLAGASESSTVSVSVTGTAGYTMAIGEWTVDSSNALSGSNAQWDLATNPGTDPTPAVTPTAGKHALVVCASANRGASLTTPTVNGTTANVRVNITGLMLYDQEQASTSGTYQGNVNASDTANPGAGAIMVFIGNAGATPAKPTPTNVNQAVNRAAVI